MPAADAIIVVSGLPRSGTSMMMSMLEAGGIPLVTDGERSADEDNPRGYFELEQVKRLEHDQSWLAGCEGKAVKIISRLLLHLPADRRYQVLFMRRSIDEILASQRKMLERRGEYDTTSDAEMKAMFFAHLEEVMEGLDCRSELSVRYVNYGRVLADPAAELEKIAALLGPGFHPERAKDRIDARLYRNRA